MNTHEETEFVGKIVGLEGFEIKVTAPNRESAVKMILDIFWKDFTGENPRTMLVISDPLHEVKFTKSILCSSRTLAYLTEEQIERVVRESQGTFVRNPKYPNEGFAFLRRQGGKYQAKRKKNDASAELPLLKKNGPSGNLWLSDSNLVKEAEPRQPTRVNRAARHDPLIDGPARLEIPLRDMYSRVV